MAKIKRDPKRTEAIKKFLELYQPESVDDFYVSLKDIKVKDWRIGHQHPSRQER